MKVIRLDGAITRKLTTDTVQQVRDAVEQGEKDIQLHLDCEGGIFGAAVECLDALQTIQSETPDLNLSTHNMGSVFAAGMLVFLAGRRRFGRPRSLYGFSRVLIQPPPGASLTQSEARDLGRKADELVETIYRNETGIGKMDAARLFPESRTYKTASWALRNGFIHEILD